MDPLGFTAFSLQLQETTNVNTTHIAPPACLMPGLRGSFQKILWAVRRNLSLTAKKYIMLH